MPPRDADGVEALAVDEPVDLDGRGLVRGEPRRAPARACGSALSPTQLRAECARSAVGAELDAEVAVAAALDLPVRRLAEDREVAREQVGPVAREPPEAVELGGDLLVVVPHPRDVDDGVGELDGELQLHGDAGLHVDGAAAPEVVDRRRSVSNRVGRLSLIGTVSRCPAITTRRSRPRFVRATTVSPSRITSRWACPGERLLDEVGEQRLVARDARHVADRPGDARRSRRRGRARASAWQVYGPARPEVDGRVAVPRHRPADTLDSCPPPPTPPTPPAAPPGATGSRRSPATAPCSTPGSRRPRSARPAGRPRSPAELAALAGATTRRDVARRARRRSRSTSTRRRRAPPTRTCGCTCSRTCSCAPTRSTSTASSRTCPPSCGPTRARCIPADFDRLRPALQRAGIHADRARQVPAPARLRHARAGAHRRCLARAPRRPPRPRHHRHARGLRELQRRHARHLDGRGTHLAGRRRRRRQRHRRRRLDHGHALGRRHAARRRSASARCSARTRASASRSATTRVVEAGLYVTAGTKVVAASAGRRGRPHRQGRRALGRAEPAVPPQLAQRRRSRCSRARATGVALNAALHA